MENREKNARKEKVDAADAKDGNETYLPGQIPIDEVDRLDEYQTEERQPDPVQAEQAVNPELQGAERDQRKPDPAAKPPEDRSKR